MLKIWNSPVVSSLPVVKNDRKLSNREYVHNVFDDLIEAFSNDMFQPVIPKLGIEHKKNEKGDLSIAFDVPGVKEEDISIELQENQLTVKGQRKTETSSYSIFKSFTIPDGHDTENISASLKDGVLTLTVPVKPEPVKEVKKISIKPT
jgi:HSP20 family protein